MLAPQLEAQSGTASLELLVQAAPSGGRPENVMQHSFYLLRAPLAEIEQQARAQVSPPDFNAFVDELKVSPELKEWMKREQTVTLAGDDFLAALTVDDIMDVPEFRDAYVTRNLIMVGLGFPKRKAKLTDREKNPAKWEESEKRYWEQVRSYAILHPESKQGLDESLLDITASTDWKTLERRHEQQVEQRVQYLVHSVYRVAEAETDYAGKARMSGLPAGRFWLTNLGREVRAGDVRLRWELPVEIGAGQSHYLELNNANAVPPARP